MVERSRKTAAKLVAGKDRRDERPAIGQAKPSESPKAEEGRSKADAPPTDVQDLTPVVGKNLRRFRSERGLSLEGLSKLCGVSRAMLGQIELGHSTPTINVVWKIACSMDMPFSALISEERTAGTWVLPRSKARILASKDGVFTSRALFPMDRPRTVEFYELRLMPSGREDAEPHAPGTTENLIVSKGRVALAIDGDRRLLEEGDAIFFEADVPHSYENVDPAEDAVMHLVMTYTQKS